ncbi:MAG: IS21-like element helper ATPase IstB [Acidithiobacillus ferrivorans]
MLMQDTIQKLNAMRLIGMARGTQDQLADHEIGSLDFEERLGLLVDQEWTYRENRRLGRLLKEARLRENASLEDVDWREDRGLNRSQIKSLATLKWISESRNVIITGATGTGKTYLACAFGNACCRQGHRSHYFRTSKLFEQVKIAKADGSYLKLTKKLAKARLLILDDWGLAALTDFERQALLEILEDRYNVASTIVASQMPVSHWHEFIGNPTLADAILDRLIHNAYKIDLKGGSMRKKRALLDGKPSTMKES